MRSFYILLLMFALLLAGCKMPSAAPVQTEPLPAAYTQAAQTIIAQLTQSAPIVLATDAPTIIEPTQVMPTDTAVPTIPPSETPTASPTIQPTPQPTANLKVVFEDNFKRKGRWYEFESDDYSFQYLDEAYLITVDMLNAPIWSIRESNFSDVVLEVDVRRYAGPQDGYFGLVCRHVDEDNYYTLVIGSDGAFGIAKMEDGEFEWLDEGQDQSGVIKQDEEVNRVRAVCVGDKLTLFVNGQLLLEVSDDDISDGVVGLLAGTRLSSGLQALFDNFAILEP